MSDTKKPVRIKELGDGKYTATDGRRIIQFRVDDQFNVTILDKEGETKTLVFEGSNPAVMLGMGRVLKHIAGFALKLKREAMES